jgi:glutathione synthase/RimK-type ligase-like ATP-grasp enzyme
MLLVKMSVLILSSPADIHAAAVQWGLCELGYESTLWDWSDYPNSDVGNWSISSRCQDEFSLNIGMQEQTKKFSSIWYRRPQKSIASPKSHPDDVQFIHAESNAFLRNMLPFLASDKTSWINFPSDATNADNKMWQLFVAKEVGMAIPATLISNDVEKVRHFFAAHGGRVIYKGFNANSWRNVDGGATLLYTAALTAKDLESEFSISACPGIFQELIEKQYEVRVTVIGDTLIAAKIDSQKYGATIDWRSENEIANLPLEAITLPAHIETMCFLLCRKLNLFYGAIDFIVTPFGEFIFLEINESGQFLWKEYLNPNLMILDRFCRALITRSGNEVIDTQKQLKILDWHGTTSHLEYLTIYQKKQLTNKHD